MQVQAFDEEGWSNCDSNCQGMSHVAEMEVITHVLSNVRIAPTCSARLTDLWVNCISATLHLAAYKFCLLCCFILTELALVICGSAHPPLRL